ncbi:hypothetical protein D3C86_1792100 [compost metagenome]
MPSKPKDRHKYISSSIGRCLTGLFDRRSNSWKNFSPPKVSLWKLLSRLIFDHSLSLPHDVVTTASSATVQST